MDKRIRENLNKLFNSYDLFSSSGVEKNRSKMRSEIPDITDDEIKEVDEYLQDFYDFCSVYGRKIAEKYKLSHLPYTEEARKEVAEYTYICRERFPEVEEMHIRELFSTVCCMINR